MARQRRTWKEFLYFVVGVAMLAWWIWRDDAPTGKNQ